MTTFSKKQHNYSYAPGITTYGIDGKSGAQGNSGNCIFYSSYNLTTSNSDIINFAIAISKLQLPIENKIEYLDRKYQNGDLFIDKNGNIIEITDIDNLAKAPNNATNCKKYFKVKGNVNVINNSSINVYNNYAYLNATGTGLVLADLINRGSDTTSTLFNKTLSKIDSSAMGWPTLLLISNNDYDTGNINFINLNTVSGISNNIELKLYYNKNENAYHIDSSYPIIIDANLYVKYDEDNTEAISDYAKVVTDRRNSLTHYVGYSKLITYKLDTSLYAYTNLNDSTKYYGMVYIVTLNADEDILTTLYESNHTKTLHILKESYQDFHNILENREKYYFKQELNYINAIDASNYIADTSTDIQISLINNVEVYLQKTN